MDELQAQRSGMAAMETALVNNLGAPPPELEEYYHTFTTSSGWQTTVKVWRQRQTSVASTLSKPSPRSLILLFHGGGFCVGSIEQTTREGRELALTYDAVVVSATCRLAPEHKFPVFVNDAIDVAEWMSEHAGEVFGASLSGATGCGFVVGGASSGAQAAAMIASEARQKDWKFKPTGLFLAIPNVLADEIVPQQYRHLWTSRTTSHGSMTPEILALMLELQGADVRSPLYSPFNSPLGLQGLPRTYVQVGGKDPLRDDGIVFARALEDTGVEVRWDVYEELGHGGYGIGWDEATAPKGLRENTINGLGWLLKKA